MLSLIRHLTAGMSYLKWWKGIENGGYSEQSTHKENDSKNFYSSLPIFFEPQAFSVCFRGTMGNHCNSVESILISLVIMRLELVEFFP